MTLKESSAPGELRNTDYSLHLGESQAHQPTEGSEKSSPFRPLPQLVLIQSVLLDDKALFYRTGLLGTS